MKRFVSTTTTAMFLGGTCLALIWGAGFATGEIIHPTSTDLQSAAERTDGVSANAAWAVTDHCSWTYCEQPAWDSPRSRGLLSKQGTWGDRPVTDEWPACSSPQVAGANVAEPPAQEPEECRAVVPEPASGLLLAAGAVLTGRWLRKKG